jgi:hypothetical protein
MANRCVLPDVGKSSKALRRQILQLNAGFQQYQNELKRVQKELLETMCSADHLAKVFYNLDNINSMSRQQLAVLYNCQVKVQAVQQRAIDKLKDYNNELSTYCMEAFLKQQSELLGNSTRCGTDTVS